MKSKGTRKKNIRLAMGCDSAPGRIITRKQRAVIVGEFAYFETEHELWNITHVPTGGFLFNTYSEDDAKAAIAFMSNGLDWTWGEFGESRFTSKRKRKHFNRARAAYKKWHTSEVSL